MPHIVQQGSERHKSWNDIWQSVSFSVLSVSSLENFDLVEVPVPEPGNGELLVRNLVMSVDPYMRGRMNDAKSYVPPFEIGGVMGGGAVARVVGTNNPAFEEGDIVE